MTARILLTDDEPYVLDVCRRILQDDYEVKIVNSGLEAIQVAQYEQFDVLLTDIKMPGIDGLETAQEVKKIQPDIVCITMTAFGTMEMAIKALRLGVDEFVIKPFSPEELTLVIERALEKEQLRQENIRLKSLMPLFEFNKSLMSTVDTRLLLEQILDLAVSETNATGAVLYMDNDEGRLSYLMHKDVGAEALKVIEANSNPLIAQIKNNSEQLILREEVPVEKGILQELSVKSVVITPLLGKQTLLGILFLLKQDQQFTQSECNFLSVMTGQAATAYANAQLFEDLQQAYDELKTLDHMKNEFINIAAHELRTPLAILMGYASVLEEDAEGVTQKYLETILRNAMRLRSLITALIDMSNLQSGQLQLAVSKIDLVEMITQMASDISIIADKKAITLDIRFEQSMPVIYSDRQKLELIITNLLTNAIKFTPPNGKVFIEGWADADKVRVAVSDTGVGIPEKELSRIFKRFYQVENSLNREHEGIGLGLSIVQGLLKECGGTIAVESEVGKGSKFTFTLPISLPDLAMGNLQT